MRGSFGSTVYSGTCKMNNKHAETMPSWLRASPPGRESLWFQRVGGGYHSWSLSGGSRYGGNSCGPVVARLGLVFCAFESSRLVQVYAYQSLSQTIQTNSQKKYHNSLSDSPPVDMIPTSTPCTAVREEENRMPAWRRCTPFKRIGLFRSDPRFTVLRFLDVWHYSPRYLFYGIYVAKTMDVGSRVEMNIGKGGTLCK
ncbi:hypothetical protein BDP81DRAFT_83245 [Colletotrichum phormii]|uniref:Uncharacterized protein n=1 Tax=Colletotrichum phormii TaxID=359342 RepID=A0AAJ0A4G1_9PEZI|nr:uncharacterized protein BDP81DRAFT_83245 [Colletotrichum phormii]KAK1654430.1 hypothetical protein BDP81DRAFT_83245 [Colletotrichum phormii]